MGKSGKEVVFLVFLPALNPTLGCFHPSSMPTENVGAFSEETELEACWEKKKRQWERKTNKKIRSIQEALLVTKRLPEGVNREKKTSKLTEK